MDGVATPIIGRPRPLPGHDTPNPAYHPHTLNYEEPAIVPITRFALGKDEPRGIMQRSHTTRFNTLRPQPTIVGWGLSTDVSRETIADDRRDQ